MTQPGATADAGRPRTPPPPVDSPEADLPLVPAKLLGHPGIDIFTLAGEKTISGWLTSYKAPPGGLARQPYATLAEQALALYLEYHPHVLWYHRGDIKESFARAHRLATPLGAPYDLPYIYEGGAHSYLPDWVGRRRDGSLIIGEAGLDQEKRQARAMAKTEVAARWAAAKGGAYWLGTESTVVRQRHWNLVHLHARRAEFPSFAEIAQTLLPVMLSGEPLSVRDLVTRFSGQWPAREVEGATWKLAAEAAAAGRLLVDLDHIALDSTTPLTLLGPQETPILPPDLPSALPLDPAPPDHEPRVRPANRLPGPTIDAEAIACPRRRARFVRNLHAVLAVYGGSSQLAAARQHGLRPQALSILLSRLTEHGQLALLPHATYVRERALHPAFKDLIRRLYLHPSRQKVMAVYEDARLRAKAEELTAAQRSEALAQAERLDTELADLAARLQDGSLGYGARERAALIGRLERLGGEAAAARGQAKKLVLAPSYWQVYRYCRDIANDRDVREDRSGLAHPPPPRRSTRSFVLSIPGPAVVCQVDEHYWDQLVVGLDGEVITSRVHVAVLICVKTAAILSMVLSLKALCEEDYMRLLKGALEPKAQLAARCGCKNPWPCQAKPAIILHDRGAIFVSKRSIEVVVDRLQIISERAPAYAPQVKGTVEALFRWMTEKVAHRMPGTTKGSAQVLGAYNPVKDAGRFGITLDVLEELLVQAIVDGYMREWDPLRRQRRCALWDEAVEAQGVPQYLGSPDDLILLLMRSVNRKHLAGRYRFNPDKGVSFLGRWYLAPDLSDRLRGQEVEIRFDRRDISVIYLFLNGAYVSEAYCVQFRGRRVSLWEANAMRKADRAPKAAAMAESLENRQDIQEQAHAGKGRQRRRTKQIEIARQLDQQRGEVHPAHVQAIVRDMRRLGLAQGQSPPLLPLDGVPEQERWTEAVLPLTPRVTLVPEEAPLVPRRPIIRERETGVAG